MKNKEKKNKKKGSFSFKVALVMAILSIVTAVIYRLTLGRLGERLSLIPMYLLIGGGAGFFLLALIKQPRMGAAALALTNFAGLLVFAATIYEYVMEQAMIGIADMKELPAIAGCAVSMLVVALMANLMAWTRMKKKEVKE